MKLIRMTGRLRYSHTEGYGYRLVVEVCPGLSMLYQRLIPKWFARPFLHSPTLNYGLRAKPHITVIRREKPKNLKAWGRYEGELIEFFYAPEVRFDGKVYFWLDCYSKRLEEIAEELGMAPFVNYVQPVEGYRKVWHTTVANMKETQ